MKIKPTKFNTRFIYSIFNVYLYNFKNTFNVSTFFLVEIGVEMCYKTHYF
jgi:hypothetical protein